MDQVVLCERFSRISAGFCWGLRGLGFMPTLLKRAGDEDYYLGRQRGSNKMDFSVFLPAAPCMGAVCSRKKSRVDASQSLGEPNLKRDSKDLFSILPDECLFEIFRRLPGSRDRSICAGVSKRWLTLQSSMHRSEFKNTSKPFSKVFGESPHGHSNNTAQLTKAADLVQDSYEDLCDEDFSEAAGEQANVMDIDDGSKRTAERGMSKKKPCWATGDLTRCLEGKKATDNRLSAIAVCTGGHGGLGKLLIRGSISYRGITNIGLSAIGIGCPALRDLSLWNCPLVGDSGLAAIAKGCKLLEKLDLCKCPWIGDKGLESVSANCPNLLTLNLESCSQVGNKSLKAIGQNCVRLQSLSINDCFLVSDEGVITILSNTKTLMKLKLQALRLTDITLAAVGHYGKFLTDLWLESLPNVTEKGFLTMGNTMGLQKMKHLSVTSCRGLTDVSIEVVGQSCLSLKQVSIRKCESLTDKGLRAFTHVAISLENFQIEECKLISCCGLIDVLSNCSGKLKVLSLIKCEGIKESTLVTMPIPVCESLKSLNIRHCPGFGNGCLAMLGRAFPQLQQLDLSGLSRISDDGLLALLESSKTSLVKVNLSGCVQVTDWAIFGIANLCGENLQTLILDGCRKVTDRSLKVIADLCPALQDLDLAKCGITDNGIVSLLSARQQAIQILSLSGCMQITDKCLPFIEKMGETLLGLNLQHCSGLSQMALDSVGAHLWQCDLLVS